MCLGFSTHCGRDGMQRGTYHISQETFEKCNACGQSFQTKSTLKRHIKSTHENNVKYGITESNVGIVKHDMSVSQPCFVRMKKKKSYRLFYR